ncbi:hypothetical protein EDC30_10170 [Paucimonas lemoignei]|uniref:Uncharacterized protein n=1 Tax=Paucimonas lemoignei TaxID=29443 RepID=A0A4V2UJ93_PAULE|nr:hypothetical protein [Paucimonas lemoignei]TCS39120.1 hypothetical protein EDC30_10170 [Paucimonas lemoignei]
MADQSIDIRKRAMEHFKQQKEFSPEAQTRICLFLQGVKSINATILTRVEFQPMEWVPYKFLHNQCFKEVELTTLLGKSTAWSSNPMVFFAATQLNLSLWQETGAARFMGGFIKVDRNFYEYLALSHAFLSVIRILPLLSVQTNLNTPFFSALKEVEEENGRQIQTQIRLLKDMAIDLSQDEKEQIIEAQRQVVERLFLRLLAEITATEAA